MIDLEQILDDSDHLAGLSNLIKEAVDCSPYFKRLIIADLSLLEVIMDRKLNSWTCESMFNWLDRQTVIDESSLKKALRKLKQNVMVWMIVNDINQNIDLFEVMKVCSYLAEVSVKFSIKNLSNWLQGDYGLPMSESNAVQELIVTGMGKLGGYELNVSSDIDLIFAFEEDGYTNGRISLSNQEYFTLLSKKLISSIDEITEDGFVFRVDMRLRPYGSEGPLVCSLASLEDYYQNMGREWERYAWIKGRVIAGPSHNLTSLLRPFVFRKYLDYGTIASMRDLKSQIQRDVNRKDQNNNIKLGRGGIREIEFIVQAFQLMRGGQDLSLQIRPTLDVLNLLAEKGLIPKENANELRNAYIFLRTLEHRLQYYENAQTHDLPKNEMHQAVIAKSMKAPNWLSLFNHLQTLRDFVSQQFDKVFAYEQSLTGISNDAGALWSGTLEFDEMVTSLTKLGYDSSEETAEYIKNMRKSNKIQRLPEISRKRLDSLMPNIIELCGKRYNSNETLNRMIVLLETICRRANYLAFFVEYPHVLERLVLLIGASPWLANYLTQHPILLDGLLDSNSYSEPDIYDQELVLTHNLEILDCDTERQMNALREFQQAKLFAFACEDVINQIPLPTLSGHLSNLADMILRVVMKFVWATFKGKHIVEPKFAIVAYGKLGSRELGYSSDLDLVFIYKDDHPDARDIYSRFGMRIIAWLNTMTSSGILYEIDTQLRPDGGSGLLVCSIEGFANYQYEKAWVWEHQAITRARFVAGDPEVGKDFEEIRLSVITQIRDLKQLRIEITEMRQKINKSHHFVEGRFDLKYGLGGMVDVEFIVQYLVLAYANKNPSLCENRGNIQTLRLCSVLGLIPPELGQRAADSYYKLRQHQHALRLQGYREAWVPEATMIDSIKTIRTLWRKVFYEENG